MSADGIEHALIAPPRIRKGGPSPEARPESEVLCPGGNVSEMASLPISDASNGVATHFKCWPWSVLLGSHPGVAPGSFGADLTRQRAHRAALGEAFGLVAWPRRSAANMGKGNATWLILPVVICLSQRLSHACVSINSFVL